MRSTAQANQIKTSPRILLLDIETAPALGWVWRKWQTDVIEFSSNWYMLSFAYKWYGEDKDVSVKALVDYKGYKASSEDDRGLIVDLWSLLEEADIVIGHNIDFFDIRKANARISFHKLPPPAPFKTVDTKKVAQQFFDFDSNKLNDLGVQLGMGKKLPHSGFDLWRGCMSGDRASWKLMKDYNIQDVVLLEKIYVHFRPWMRSHPNVGMWDDDTSKPICPKCGGGDLQSRGYSVNNTTKYHRFQCKACGGWARSRVNNQKGLKVVNG